MKSKAYNKSEKGKASQMVRDAVRQGKLKKLPCEVCDTTEDVHGHHDDYSKPLEVRWLCGQHHREEHLYEDWQNELRRAGYEGGFLLGQLIEACGEEFYGLVSESNEYGDWHTLTKDEGMLKLTSGSTPEEAVARLWLALNKEKPLNP